MQIEQNVFAAAVGLSGCHLVNNIMPAGLDVKGGGAVLNYTPITINLDREAGQPVRFPLHLVPKLQ